MSILPALTFQPASQSDFERLLDLRIRALRPSLERIGRFDLGRARAWFERGFDPAFMRLVHGGERFVGCVSLRPDPPGATWVEHFYIEPDMHNQGFGAAVMNAIIAEAETAGATLRLAVLRESDANRFYQRHGFSETHSEAYDIYYERSPDS